MKIHLAAAALALLAQPALALDVKESTRIAAPIDQVWAQIGDFCGIAAWHPAVEGCTLRQRDGAQERDIALKGGGSIVERRQAASTAKHWLRYSIVSGPLPVENYVSTLRLTAVDAKTTRIVWSSRFKAKGAPDAEAKTVIAGIYTAGFDGLRKALSGK